MPITTAAPVVVGVDGSDDARLAIDLAAWEANRAHCPLRMVYGFQPVHSYGMVAVGYDLDRQVHDLEEMLTTESERVSRRYPDLIVSSHVVRGIPASVLVDESAAARLVVVGSRGLGGFASLLIGSVSAQVAAHAKAPVIVVRPPAARGERDMPGSGPVVVGVDGSTGSAAAVEFAFDEAAARGTDLIAVYAWDDVARNVHDDDPQLEQHVADATLVEALAGWQDKYPEVPVRYRAVHSSVPVRAILDESGGADLIVVGPRGRNGIAGLLLGSVGEGLIHHANTPVAVVHTTTNANTTP